MLEYSPGEKNEKTNRTRAIAGSKSDARSRQEIKPEIEAATGPGAARTSKNHRAVATRPDDLAAHRKRMHKDLPALAAKIGRMLATKSEHFVTQPVELNVLRALSDAELRAFAHEHGWRMIRRVGGRQIEFYNDAGLRPNE